MKKLYIQPEMLVVVMQHNINILQASDPVTGTSGNSGLSNGGSSDGYVGPDGGAAKGSTNVWDEEW